MPTSKSLFKTVSAMVTGATILLASVTAFAGPPTDFVKLKSDALFTIINKPTSDKRTKELKKEVRSLIAYDELAKRALGDHWTKRTDDERKVFLGLLEELVELNYANRFSNEKADIKYVVNYTGEKVRASTGQAIVKTEVKYSGDLIELDYKLLSSKDPAPYIIYDVQFDDVSLEETYRESYVPIINKEGWGSLIKRMEDRLKELRKKGK